MKWAANQDKLRRAKAMAKSDDVDKIKECYIKLGGLVLEEPKKKKNVQKDNN